MKNWEMKREISAILITCCLLHAMLRYPYHYIHHTFDLYALYTLTCFPHYTTKNNLDIKNKTKIVDTDSSFSSPLTSTEI